MGADHCTTAAEVDALLAERARAAGLTDEAAERLRALARRVAAARALVDRTVDRAAEGVEERRAERGTGIAIHPSAVRERAATVAAARGALADAEARLREAEADAERAAAPVPAMAPAGPWEADDRTPPASAPRRKRRWRRRRGAGGRADEQDTSESTSLLQQIAASTDEAFGARRSTSVQDERLLLARAQRDRRQEEVLVAERAWRDLAGDEPVEDVEGVVRRFDPHYEVALDLARETIGARAASQLVDLALEAWAEGWRAVGLQPPGTAEVAEVERAVARVADRAARPVVLVGEAAESADAVARALPAAPVVVVERG